MSEYSDLEPQDMGGVVRIDRLSSDGRGVGRLDGLVVFVDRAVPGDIARVRTIRRHKRYVEAVLIGIEQPSPLRRDAACDVQDRCGGCPWMVLPESDQRQFKRDAVSDAIRRIGGIADFEPDPVRHRGPDVGYRGKIELTLAAGESGARRIAMHRSPVDPQDPWVDIPACPIQAAPADRALAAVRPLLLAPGRSAPWSTGEPFRLVLRSSHTTGKVLVALRGPAVRWPGERRFGRRLMADCEDIAGVVRIEARSGKRGGGRTRVLAGAGTLTETLGNTTFDLPAGVFFQVNPAAAKILVDIVAEMAGDVAGARAMDLYGGVGLYAWRLAAAGAEVVVSEADPDAVACGESARSAATVAIPPRFRAGDVGHWLESRPRGGPPPDLVVANPPRTGFGPRVAQGIADLGASRVVIVSCDAGTLARDVAGMQAGGYRLRRVIPVDLFPQTPHIETVSCLERSPAS